MNHSPGAFGLASPLITHVDGDGFDDFETSTSASMRSSTRRRRGYNEARDKQPPAEWERTLLDLERMQKENKVRLQGSMPRASHGPSTSVGATAPGSGNVTPTDASLNAQKGATPTERLSASAMRRRRGQLAGHSQEQEQQQQQRRLDALVAEHRQKSPSPAPITREEEVPASAPVMPTLTLLEEDEELHAPRPIPRMPLDWNEETPAPAAQARPRATASAHHLPTRRGPAGTTTSGSGSGPSPTAPHRSKSPEVSPKPTTPPQPTDLPTPSPVFNSRPTYSNFPPNSNASSAVTKAPAQSRPTPLTRAEASPSPLADARGPLPEQQPFTRAAAEASTPPPATAHAAEADRSDSPAAVDPAVSATNTAQEAVTDSSSSAPRTAVAETVATTQQQQQQPTPSDRASNRSTALPSRTRPKSVAGKSTSNTTSTLDKGASSGTQQQQTLSAQPSVTASVHAAVRGLPSRATPAAENGTSTTNPSGITPAFTAPPPRASNAASVRRRSVPSNPSPLAHPQPRVDTSELSTPGRVPANATTTTTTATATESHSTSAATPLEKRQRPSKQPLPLEREESVPSSARHSTRVSGGVPMTTALTELRRQEVLRERRERERQAEEEATLRASLERSSRHGYGSTPPPSTRRRRNTAASTTMSVTGSTMTERHRRPRAAGAGNAPSYATPTASSGGAVVARPKEAAAAAPTPHESPSPSVMSSLIAPQRQKKAAATTTTATTNTATTVTTATPSEPAKFTMRRPSFSPGTMPSTSASSTVSRRRRSIGQKHVDPKATAEPRARRSAEALPRAAAEDGSPADVVATAPAGKPSPPSEPTALAVVEARPSRASATPAEREDRRTTGGEELQPPTAMPVPFCTECGRRHIDEGTKFCAFCGHKREYV